MTVINGLNLPTQRAMIGATPRDSAIAAQTAANNTLTNLNKSVGGKRRKHIRSSKYNKKNKKYYGGVANTIPVPQFNMQYTPQGGPGQTPNDIIKQNSQTSTQSVANAAFDKFATKHGGYILSKNTHHNSNKLRYRINKLVKSIKNNKSIKSHNSIKSNISHNSIKSIKNHKSIKSIKSNINKK